MLNRQIHSPSKLYSLIKWNSIIKKFQYSRAGTNVSRIRSCLYLFIAGKSCVYHSSAVPDITADQRWDQTWLVASDHWSESINRFILYCCDLPCLRGWQQSASIDSSSPDKPSLRICIQQAALKDVFLEQEIILIGHLRPQTWRVWSEKLSRGWLFGRD